MAIKPNMGPTLVADGESPLYTEDSTPPPNTNIDALSQATGSGLDSETVQGILAVTATVGGPNKLVATDGTGKLPISIIPTGNPAAGVPGYVTGTYATIKATNPAAITFGIASTPGSGYTLMFYLGKNTVGDNGWIVLGGG